MTNLESTGKPELEARGDAYQVTWPCQIEAEVDRIVEHRDELSAEVTIRSARQPRPGLLHSARLNLMSSQARRTLATALARRDDGLDWDALLEGLCFLVREAYRRGEPPIDLREYERSAGARWFVEPFVEFGGPTVLFADGGTGKSLLAIGVAATASQARPVLGQLHGAPRGVLYLDYETDVDTFDERFSAVLAGAGIETRPPVFYKRLAASIDALAPTLRREIAEREVGFVVVDSLGYARGGEPESADFTIRLFNAMRSLGVPWLGIDHVTKEKGNDSRRPFGSTYTHNAARLTWSLDKAPAEDGDEAMVLALVNHKRNNGRLLPRRGYRVELANDERERLVSVRFRLAELARVFPQKATLRERILAELRDGPKRPELLIEAAGADARQIRARLSELRRREVIVDLPDGMVALRARASA